VCFVHLLCLSVSPKAYYVCWVPKEFPCILLSSSPNWHSIVTQIPGLNLFQHESRSMLCVFLFDLCGKFSFWKILSWWLLIISDGSNRKGRRIIEIEILQVCHTLGFSLCVLCIFYVWVFLSRSIFVEIGLQRSFYGDTVKQARVCSELVIFLYVLGWWQDHQSSNLGHSWARAL
jgi:hypothetical protein